MLSTEALDEGLSLSVRPHRYIPEPYEPDRWLETRKTARDLGLSKNTVWRWVILGIVRGRKIGRHWYISARALADAMLRWDGRCPKRLAPRAGRWTPEEDTLALARQPVPGRSGRAVRIRRCRLGQVTMHAPSGSRGRDAETK